MKRLIIIVEGQTEEEFVNEILCPYLLNKHGILSVTPIKIAKKGKQKGGFVNYHHLKNDVKHRIHESNIIVSMFVDFFRIPTSLPNYKTCMSNGNIDDKIICLEEAIESDIGADNFIPYIQKHEFESLLFSSNHGFEAYWEEDIFCKTQDIINDYPYPEEINSHPETAPSKRILSVINNYDKVIHGNLIALEIGIEKIMEKCPRFKAWIDKLVEKVSGN